MNCNNTFGRIDSFQCLHAVQEDYYFLIDTLSLSHQLVWSYIEISLS